MPTQMELKHEEIVQIVESVFRDMLELEVVEYTPAAYARRVADAGGCGDPDRVMASVELSGDWNGVVAIACKSAQACLLAGRFLSMECPQRVDDVVCDVIGELTNMIGGNLKCVLARGIKLSTPHVTHGVESPMEDRNDYSSNEVWFRCQGGNFSVTVLAAP
jgi:chemotaxis protein CheX